MKSQVAALLVALVAWASPAFAQSYVVTQSTQPYVPLVGATVATIAAAGTTAPAMDDGNVVVPPSTNPALPLGFTFPFYGANYTEVLVNTNGLLIFGRTCEGLCYYNSVVPSTVAPNSIIAPWWDDLKGQPGSEIRYKNTSPTEMVIEFANWGTKFGTATSPLFSFQIRLNASGLFQVHYGPKLGTFSSANNGFENFDGTAGGNFFPCGATLNGCTDANWIPDTVFTVGQPVDPDLTVDGVALSNMVKSGSDLSFTVTPTFRNLGQTAANNFQWKAYLSTDKVLDAGDRLVFQSTSAASVPALATTTATGAAVATNMVPGQYYVLVEADPGAPGCTAHCGAVNEFTETNNLGATTTYFTWGLDLVATSITGPANSGPGNTVSLQVNWLNQGTDPANTPNNEVAYKLVVSTDRVFDATDFVVSTGTEVVTGGATFNKSYTFTVPPNVPGGDLYWGLVIDPANQVPESNETNNSVFANAKVTIRQADLVSTSADLLDPDLGQPTRTVLMGGRTRVTTELSNIGGADARNFKVGVVVSNDPNVSLLADSVVANSPVTEVLAGASRTVTFEFVMPQVDSRNRPFTTGTHYLFVVADSLSDVGELSEGNNVHFIGRVQAEPVQFLAPAADYRIGNLEAPDQAAPGELLPVHRLIRNAGIMDGGKTTYRYYASANDIITTEDIQVMIVGVDGQELVEGEVTLPAGQVDSKTEFIRLPPTLLPGAWRLGLIVDPDDRVPELDESNNAFGALTPIQVTASALQITDSQLPDAVVGVTYSYKLRSVGAPGPVTWTCSAEGMPEGMTCSADGVVSGTPAHAGIATFTATAQGGGEVAWARLVMRVLDASSELVVTSLNLPPLVNDGSKSYSANLAAVGGAKPYVWRLVGNTLPAGITMDASGVFTGAARGNLTLGELKLQVEVTDALGNRASAKVGLNVVDADTPYISSLGFPETLVGNNYITDLAVRNAGGGQLAAPLNWAVIAGSLPPGLDVTTEGGTVGWIKGRTTTAGTFQFSLQVVDAKGRSDVADFVIRVLPTVTKLSVTGAPAVLHPGDAVDFRVEGGGNAATYRLFSGTLPPGLMFEADGRIHGTVGTEEEGALGVYNFVVESRDAAAGKNLAPFHLEVSPLIGSAGCNAGPGEGGGALWTAFAAAMLVAMASRRRCR